MSSTRRSATGVPSQERFCSAPEFESDTINGLSAAKRIGIVADKNVRELLWFIQWRSLAPRGLQLLTNELLAAFPGRTSASSHYFSDDAMDAASELPKHLVNFCLNPKSDIRQGVWFCDDLFSALVELRTRFIRAARSRLAETAVTSRINETLDFCYARKRMVLIEGVAGIGRTVAARAWTDAHAGMVRFVEVPSSSDDRSFFASVARELGVARGASFKSQQIKVRVEELLAVSDLMIAFDESQYLWGQYIRPRRTPDRMLWIKSAFDAGTAIALIAHTDFSKWQSHYVKQTLWTDEQFERRLNRRIELPQQHSKEDMLNIARAQFPDGDQRSIKLLAAYALGTDKKQASGITEALESARYRAQSAGREQVTFDDVVAALRHDHAFLPADSAAPPQAVRKAAARSLQARRTQRGANDFSILGGSISRPRIDTPAEGFTP